MELLTVIADAGPLLHLHWVHAAGWALPNHPILVVASVAAEVQLHDAAALEDPRVVRVEDPDPHPTLAPWPLDGGEAAALSLALRHGNAEAVRFLCDDMPARAAAEALGLEVIGSVGPILRALHRGGVDRPTARAALLALPDAGRLHIRPSLLRAALAALERNERRQS